MLLWAVVVSLLALAGFLILGRVPDNRRMRTRLATPSLVIGISALLLTALVAVLAVAAALDAIPGRDVLAAVGFLGLPAALGGLVAGIGAWASGEWRGRGGVGLSVASTAGWAVVASLAG